MSHIDIKRPVVVKVIMTENFRNQLIGEATETMKRIEDNFKQMEAAHEAFSAEKDDARLEERKTQLKVERERLEQMNRELNWRINELQGVQDGVEVPYRVFECFVSLKVGDNFLDKMSQAEIVIKDWEIVEIRGI
jgi:hypothetical protein